MLQRCYALSPRSRLEAQDGRWRLLCSHPLQSITLNEPAGRLLQALRPGVPLEVIAHGAGPETVALLDGLVASGALEAEYRLLPAREPPPAEVVVPAYEDAAGLALCLAALATQDYPAGSLRVTVVDDATPEPLQGRVAVPPGLRLRWLRLPANAGPASARNAGALAPWEDGAPAAGLLAFVDADCEPTPGWLAGLAALLETPDIACAGGAVRGRSREGLLARYEDAFSSLYLGPRAGPVGAPESALSYLPSCNLALRRDAFVALGGFRAGWRFAEDVELSWRLAGRGHGLFYHPDALVLHAHRTRWAGFLNRRRAYARSEDALRATYPERFRARWPAGPLLGTAGLGAALAGFGLAWLLLAAAVLGVQCLRPLWRSVRGADAPGRWGAGPLLLAGLREAAAAWLQWGRRLNRQALVLYLPAALAWPALLPLAAGVFALGALGERLVRRPPADAAPGLGTYLAGYGAECLAYSLGRLQGRLAAAWRGPVLDGRR